SALLQFLKASGLHVAATCRPEHFGLVRSLGADKLVDYTREDFTRDDERYDFVFDAVGKSTFFRCKRLLKDKGIYMSSELGPCCQNLFLPLFTRLGGGKKVKFPLPLDIRASLAFIGEALEAGTFHPLVDREYPIDAIADAYGYVASGQKVGNVLVA